MMLMSLVGAIVGLACVFTCIAGWGDVFALFRESEQERIDREFAAIVAAFDHT